jgi:hypothetical protein
MTDSLAERIRALQRRTFVDYAARLSLSEGELLALMLMLIRQGLERPQVEPLPLQEAKRRKDLLALLASGDVFGLHQLQDQEIKEVVVGRIVTALLTGRLPLSNPENMVSLARAAGIAPFDPERLDNVVSLVQAIPLIGLYGTNFNAFVSGTPIIPDLPAVGYYRHLGTCIDYWNRLLVPAAIRAFDEIIGGKKYDFKAVDAAAQTAGGDDDFVDACGAVLSLAFEETAIVSIPASFAGEPRVEASIASFSAEHFVFFHEYGHLLLGHLQLGPGVQREHEADIWASWVAELSASKQRTYVQSLWQAFGIVSVLFLLMLIEGRKGNFASDTHPLSLRRFLRLAATLDEESRNTWHQMWFLLGRLVRPTLNARWPAQFGVGWTAPYRESLHKWVEELGGKAE